MTLKVMMHSIAALDSQGALYTYDEYVSSSNQSGHLEHRQVCGEYYRWPATGTACLACLRTLCR